MLVRERISAGKKSETLSIFSPGLLLIISGFLGGLITALLLFPALIPLIRETAGGRMKEVVTGFLVTLGLLGAIAAKLLQWEYKINREAYKRVAEFHIPLVHPFFFLCLLVSAGALFIPVSDITVWMGILLLMGSAILSPVLGTVWRFWHILGLSILSPVDGRAVIEAQNFDRQLKMSFAEAKRYLFSLSLTVMDIDQSDQLKGRTRRRVQEKLLNIMDKNVRGADAVGRIENGMVVVAMIHTGSSAASVQAKRVKKVIEEHLKLLEVKGKRMSLSAGIASYAPDMASYKDLIKKARLALCRAREEGGDRIAIG